MAVNQTSRSNRVIIFALATIVVGLGLYFYLSYFQFQLPVGIHANWERLPILILAALLGYFAARALNAALFDVVLRLRRHYEAPTLVRNIFTLLAFTILFVVTFRFVYPTYDLGALFTTSAIFGVIIGLALQDTLGYFFAGIGVGATSLKLGLLAEDVVLSMPRCSSGLPVRQPCAGFSPGPGVRWDPVRSDCTARARTGSPHSGCTAEHQMVRATRRKPSRS